jgi:autotransporter-associated beta strand protein
MSLISVRGKALTRLAAFCLGTSMLTAAVPASAAIINYPNGSNNTSPIVLTDNSTQLLVDQGSATQSGTISEIGSHSVTVIGGGVMTFTAANTYSGGTVIGNGSTEYGVLVVNSDSNLGASSGSITFNTPANSFGGLLTLGSSFNLSAGRQIILASGIGVINTNGFSTTISQPISGAGTFEKQGDGTLTLLSTGTYAGGTIINGGTLALGPAASLPSGEALTMNGPSAVFDMTDHTQTIGTLTAGGTILLGAGSLTINSSAASSFAGTISGTGTLIKQGTGTLAIAGAGSFAGTTMVTAGTLQIGLYSGSTLGGNIVNNSSVAFNLNNPAVFAGTISGSGSLVDQGLGPVTLTASNTYGGNTSLSDGATLQIGNGGTAGSITGNVTTGTSLLIFDRSDAYTFAGVVSGRGELVQIGSGTLTLSGASTYTNITLINAGTLNVTGSIGGSSVSVANGATLTGTGKVSATTIASGGTLTPGSGTAPGTLTISGNLALASGSNFSDAVTPSAAGLANVSGSASINGNAIANFASGAYSSSQQYTLITAAGGVTGTFSSLATTGLPASLRASLSYDSNDVYLKLSPNALAPSLASNTTTNQHNVVAAIDAAVTAGVVPTGGFNALYGLSGASLNSAIDQISGQVGANVSNAVGQSFLSFLAVTAEGGAGSAGNYAPGSAYDAAAAPHRAQLDPGAVRVWGGGYGGHVGLSADAASGAAALSSSNVGLIGGADMQLGDGLLAGVTIDWGRQHFNSGNGSGISNDYAFGLYGRADQGPAYVTAAFGYGWHQIVTLRVVTVSGTDVLQGKQNADDFGGRIEAGWRMAMDDTTTIAPYGAFAGESFESPAYAETALAGASTFALSYAAHTSTLGRSELGAHLDRGFDLGDGSLTADLKAAWAHQLDDQPFTQANFENFATASFQVLGVRPTRDAALLGADVEVQYRSGLFLGLKGEGQFGTGTTIVEGMGTFGLRW